MRVTQRDIAEKLNISISTVSRVLNDLGDPYISEATKRNVINTAKELGYQPNKFARALATGKTQIISLLTYDVYPLYYAKVIHHVWRVTSLSNYELHIIETPREYSQKTISLDFAVDGIICFDNAEYLETIYDSIATSEKPIVSMGGGSYTTLTDYVGIEIGEAARQAVHHLASLGRDRVGYLAPAMWIKESDTRYQAYMQAINECGLEPEIIAVPPGLNDRHRSGGRSALSEYLSNGKGCPGAIFCYNDELALGALRALYDHGKRVPEDIALVGCDGIEETEYHEPPISSIVMPLREMCELAWQFLQNRIENPDLPQQKTILKPKLVIRKSSAVK